MTPKRWFVGFGVAVLVTAIAVGVVAVVGGDGGPDSAAGTTVLRSRLVRDTRPSVDDATRRALAEANTAAAFDLYHRIAASPGNVVFSPYSITTALTMASAGARHATLDQMLAVLHTQGFATADLHAAVDALDLALARERPAPAQKGHDPLELHVANSLWGQSGFAVEPAFLDVLGRWYGAPLRTLDFEHDPGGAVRAVNAWVDEHTNGKVRDLLHDLDPLTRVVLVNAVYFKASWQTTFLESGTHDGTFHTLDGRRVTVPMMSDDIGARFGSGDGWQAVDLPYDGGASMTIVMPDAGTFDAFERDMSGAVLARINGALQQGKVAVTMPRFHAEQRVDLVPVLRALGMRDAFDPNRADLTGINPTVPLYVSQVVHQATIDVDEKGTEAAAATAVVIREVSAAANRITVDRPFLYFVRDTQTGAILFMGRVTDPSS